MHVAERLVGVEPLARKGREVVEIGRTARRQAKPVFAVWFGRRRAEESGTESGWSASDSTAEAQCFAGVRRRRVVTESDGAVRVTSSPRVIRSAAVVHRRSSAASSVLSLVTTSNATKCRRSCTSVMIPACRWPRNATVSWCSPDGAVARPTAPPATAARRVRRRLPPRRSPGAVKFHRLRIDRAGQASLPQPLAAEDGGRDLRQG